jgi:hypothetical protein
MLNPKDKRGFFNMPYFFVSPPICTTKYFAGPVPMLVTLCVVPSAT